MLLLRDRQFPAQPAGFPWFRAIGLLALAGCGGSSGSSGKPTVEEVRKFRQEAAPPREARSYLAVADEPREWGLKETVTDALARIGDDAVPALIRALKDPEPRVRVQAARALSRMGLRGEKAVPGLITALDDDDEDVRQSAARALGQMGSAAKEAVPRLIGILREEEESDRSSDASP